MGLQTHHMAFPAITSLITEEERAFFQTDYDSMQALESLKVIATQEVDGNKIGLDISNLKLQAQQLHQLPSSKPGTVIAGVCIVAVLAATAMILFVFRHQVLTRMRGYSPTQVESRHLTPGEVIHDGLSEADTASQERVEVRTAEKPANTPVLFTRHRNVV